jgi:hypothetical protein
MIAAPRRKWSKELEKGKLKLVTSKSTEQRRFAFIKCVGNGVQSS